METHKKLKFTEKLSYGIADLPEAANSIIAAFLTMGLQRQPLVRCSLYLNCLTVFQIFLQVY